MSSATESCLVESKFGPGSEVYMKTKADVPAEAVWFALKDFSDARPRWWPFIAPALYRARIKVTPAEDGEGCLVEEWYTRERVGLRGKLITRMAPRTFPKMVPQGRAKTYAALAEHRPHEN